MDCVHAGEKLGLIGDKFCLGHPAGLFIPQSYPPLFALRLYTLRIVVTIYPHSDMTMHESTWTWGN